MPRVFTYRGHKLDELQKLSMDEFVQLLPSRKRRSLTRGFTDSQRTLITRIRKAKRMSEKGKRIRLRTHCRDMIVLPEMVGLTIEIHNGRIFHPVKIAAEHIGHYFGELAITNKRVVHGNPGIGATRSSQFVPLK
ncbi:MAG: 30S ribosomal protein S19 [Candidatus Ranarchaeia archaeon]